MPVPPAAHTLVDFCPAWAAEGKPEALLVGLDHQVASPSGIALLGLTVKLPTMRWMLSLCE